jgi:hypothetical protein
MSAKYCHEAAFGFNPGSRASDASIKGSFDF